MLKLAAAMLSLVFATTALAAQAKPDTAGHVRPHATDFEVLARHRWDVLWDEVPVHIAPAVTVVVGSGKDRDNAACAPPRRVRATRVSMSGD
jgi:hypothetical protein